MLGQIPAYLLQQAGLARAPAPLDDDVQFRLYGQGDQQPLVLKFDIWKQMLLDLVAQLNALNYNFLLVPPQAHNFMNSQADSGGTLNLKHIKNQILLGAVWNYAKVAVHHHLLAVLY